MQAAALRALEFDRIRDALARESLTSLGRERALALLPSTDPADVHRLLNLTVEAAAFVKAAGSLSIDGPEDLTPVLHHLEIADEPLAPLELVGLARFASSVESIADRVRSGGGSSLQVVVASVASFEEEIAAIRRAIDSAGDIADDASPALREIREALRRQRAKLRSTLEGLIRGRDTAKYLQEQIVTDRHGRYVIVVRAEHRDAIPGIVHGSSASGASLYLEPVATVSLNNDVVALSDREKEEIHRILLELTNAFRQRPEDLDALVTAAAALDELNAKVRLGARMDGVAPRLATDGRLELRGVRHPLLIPSVRDLLRQEDGDGGFIRRSPQGEGGPQVVVPSTLTIAPPTKALVISGPNTGGKTVALKAFGLLPLMAQSGLLIPVDADSAITPFRTVFADIGDEQSIAASLSTFSAHIANLVSFVHELELPALVLLDEVGGGTDPVEGGALGAAVIDHFRTRGAMVVATTHDDALKSYGATTEGVAVAAFGFNAETFAPTYALVYGAPGRSLALEVARRLGMPADVIADAERRRSGRESLLAAHLARVDQELAAVDRERQATREERAALDVQRQSLIARESKLAEREAVLKKRLDEKVAERLREARAEVDAVVTQLKSKADALAGEAEKRARQRTPVLNTGEVGDLRSQARSALGQIESTVLNPAALTADVEAFDEAPEPGQRVYVVSFGTEGIVRGISGKYVDVEIRGKRMRVPLSGVRRGQTGVKPGSDRGQTKVRPGSDQGQTALVPVTREIVVIGATVEDATDRLDKFLDQALLSDDRRLRVVHGHGTGRLRDAVRAFFRAHPLVASVAPGAANEGGDGATIVELKD
jgi:DNA mismatch repair protein MutS2